MSSPHLTIVATSRNDDHGGNLLGRMQLFVNGLFQQCLKRGLSAELLIVEWNPPTDRPGLRDVLHWPEATNSCIARIIEVPADIHKRYKHSEQLPLFQMIAKNVGIRRAKGRFILATNIDILFSNELIKFLQSGLKTFRMYRVNRFDVPMPPEASWGEQLQFCKKNILRISERDGTRNLKTGEFRLAHPPQSRQQWVQSKMQDWGFKPRTGYSRLHTNACGDFTLMAKDHWFALRGYPEWEMYSFHLDSVLCHAAHHAGFRENVLKDPMRIYHIDHSSGSGWTPEGEKILNARLAEKAIPKMTNEELETLATQMRLERKPILFNDEKWGLAGYDLPESEVNGPSRSQTR